MIICLLLEAIILSLIVLDLVKLIKKKRIKYFNFIEIALKGMLVLLFIYGILSGNESEISLWINNNSQFKLITFLLTIIWLMLDIILDYKKITYFNVRI